MLTYVNLLDILLVNSLVGFMRYVVQALTNFNIFNKGPQTANLTIGQRAFVDF